MFVRSCLTPLGRYSLSLEVLLSRKHGAVPTDQPITKGHAAIMRPLETGKALVWGVPQLGV